MRRDTIYGMMLLVAVFFMWLLATKLWDSPKREWGYRMNVIDMMDGELYYEVSTSDGRLIGIVHQCELDSLITDYNK